MGVQRCFPGEPYVDQGHAKERVVTTVKGSPQCKPWNHDPCVCTHCVCRMLCGDSHKTETCHPWRRWWKTQESSKCWEPWTQEAPSAQYKIHHFKTSLWASTCFHRPHIHHPTHTQWHTVWSHSSCETCLSYFSITKKKPRGPGNREESSLGAHSFRGWIHERHSAEQSCRRTGTELEP